jgi:hypothetical protein
MFCNEEITINEARNLIVASGSWNEIDLQNLQNTNFYSEDLKRETTLLIYCRLEDIIKMNLKVRRCKSGDSVNLA